MSIRAHIEKKLDGKAFERPLFYSYEGGLRFELPEGGNYLNQFLTDHRKAMEICSQVFSACEDITICVKPQFFLHLVLYLVLIMNSPCGFDEIDGH